MLSEDSIRNTQPDVHFIYAPFPSYALQFIKNVSAEEIQCYDLLNHSLMNKIMKLENPDFQWLISQTNEIALYNFSKKHQDILKRFELTAQVKVFVLFQFQEIIKKTDSRFYSTLQLPSLKECILKNGLFQEGNELPRRLVNGMYPQANLESLTELVTQALEGPFNNTKKIDKALKTLNFLAFNIGVNIGFAELGVWAKMDNETAKRYVELLAKIGYIFILPTYNTRAKYEYVNGRSVIFADNGCLNFHLQNFNEPSNRLDGERLWMNWVISEKIKADKILQNKNKYYCWQSHTGQKIDFIIESETGIKSAFTFNWTRKQKKKTPALFRSYYPDILHSEIDVRNYLNFLNP